jgi:enoyl-[acyl-carrier protein] reductase II
MLNRWGKPAFRVLATPYAEARERDERVTFPALADIQRLYFDGDLDAAFAFGGQVAGRIDAVEPVATIIERTVAEFDAVMDEVAARWSARASTSTSTSTHTS